METAVTVAKPHGYTKAIPAGRNWNAEGVRRLWAWQYRSYKGASAHVSKEPLIN